MFKRLELPKVEVGAIEINFIIIIIIKDKCTLTLKLNNFKITKMQKYNIIINILGMELDTENQMC